MIIKLSIESRFKFLSKIGIINLIIEFFILIFLTILVFIIHNDQRNSEPKSDNQKFTKIKILMLLIRINICLSYIIYIINDWHLKFFKFVIQISKKIKEIILVENHKLF